MGIFYSTITIELKSKIKDKKIRKGDCIICLGEDIDVIDFCGIKKNHNICIDCMNNNYDEIKKCPYCRRNVDKTNLDKNQKIVLRYSPQCYDNRIKAYQSLINIGCPDIYVYDMVKTYLINSGCSSFDECELCKKNNIILKKYVNKQNYLRVKSDRLR